VQEKPIIGAVWNIYSISLGVCAQGIGSVCAQGIDSLGALYSVGSNIR
jgi:hypothetical protein